MTKPIYMLLAVLALVVSSEARAEYVSGDVVNCRSRATALSEAVAQVRQGWKVNVTEKNGQWSHLEAPRCWVLSRYLSVDYIAAPASRSAVTSPSRSTGHKAAQPSRLFGTSRSKKRKVSRPLRGYDGACPCSGSRVCIGPRGGRYCITSGGNKRYGM